MFLAALAVLLSIRVSKDFGGAEKLSAAVAIKPDCHLHLLWSCFLTDSAACVLSFQLTTTPLHMHMSMCKHVCVCVCVHVCVRVCMHACMCVCVHVMTLNYYDTI